MSIRTLREKYGTGNAREVMNRAIRAECPGGDVVLDALEEFDSRVWQHKTDDARRAVTVLHEIRDEMAEWLLDKYKEP